MKIRPVYLLTAAILPLFLFFSGFAQQSKRKPVATKGPAMVTTGDFSSVWKRVDSLSALGQPRSALAVVEEIALRAKSSGNDPQYLKCVIYRIRLTSEFEEQPLEKTITALRKEIAAASPPSRQLLHSLLAEVYSQYARENQFRFQGRTRQAVPDTAGVDAWDASRLARASMRHYLASLEQADTLKKIPVERFAAVIGTEIFPEPKKDTLLKEAARYAPTLYDFLAGRAIDYFTADETGGNLPAERFEADQPWFFAQSVAFVMNRAAIPADSSSPASFALRTFRDLVGFHLRDADPRALISIEIRRLAFVHSVYTGPSGDSLYLDALKQFNRVHAGSPHGTWIAWTLAGFLRDQGSAYQPLVSGRHQWDLRSAVELCDEAVRNHPSSAGAENCRLLAEAIRRPSLRLTTEQAVASEKPSLALVGATGLRSLHLRVVRADEEKLMEESAYNRPREFISYLLSLPVEKKWSINLPDEGDFQPHAMEAALPPLPAGLWVLIASAEPEPSQNDSVLAFTPFWSTRISYVSKRNDDGSYDYFFLERETGLPLKGLKVENWQRSYSYRERRSVTSLAASYATDEQGALRIPSGEKSGGNVTSFLKVYRGDDRFITGNFYQYPSWKGPEQTIIQTRFYTDRAIYRPGQTISFKGIMTEQTGERTRLKTRYVTRVVFTDANGQKIAEQSLATNDFGSFSGTFVAPSGVLPGDMTLSNETGSVTFPVEEYRRPTFEVTFDPVEGNYRLGETVRVTGKATDYAGSPVDGASVRFRVTRNTRFPFFERGGWWPIPASPTTEIATGTVITDPDGKFTLTFTARPDPSVDRETLPVFDFSVTTDVTALNGETQSASTQVSAGYRAWIVSAAVPERVNLRTDTAFVFVLTNAGGTKVPSTVAVKLERLRQPDRVFVGRAWERPDRFLMTESEFRSSFPYHPYRNENDMITWPAESTVREFSLTFPHDSLLRLNLADPGPGAYLVTLSATDPYGEAVIQRYRFVAFEDKAGEVPVNTLNWFVPLTQTARPGEKARFLLGSKEDDVRVICEVRLRDSIIRREIISLSDRTLLYEVPVREEYRGNFGVQFLFVKHSRAFHNSVLVTVPWPERKLDISVSSFRDRIEPGSSERWTLVIRDPSGKPARAELMAGMYDASLDVFRRNNWAFSVFQRINFLAPWETDDAFRTSSGQDAIPAPAGQFRSIPGLQFLGFGGGPYGRYRGRYAGARDKATAMEVMTMSDDLATPGAPSPPPPPPPEAKGDGMSEQDPGLVNETGMEPGKPVQKDAGLQVRRDFRETAFFYPAVVTDSTGSLTLEFTAPESLTRWNFMGLAHTQALEYGTIRKELVTRKDLMVFPNAPRFVRQGDTLFFSARVVNLSDTALEGMVTLTLTDGLTLSPLTSIASPPAGKSFFARKGESAVVVWRLAIPVSADLSVLQYRFVAVAGTRSDGEERSLPVLTNRTLVTETLPLPVRGAGDRQFTFDRLLASPASGTPGATMTNYRLTVEFAANPAWYAVQALPSLNDRPYESADAVFRAFWSNSMASHIANSDPKIRAVFEAWKNLSPGALKSNLEKNQDLKSVLLQETPWVNEAASETERKQRLGQYFDPAAVSANLRDNLSKLRKLQTPSGGWVWFPGMPENRYITQHILEGLGKLTHLGAISLTDDPSLREMTARAISWLDSELVTDLANLKKYQGSSLDRNHIGSLQIQYLYARSFFTGDNGKGIPEPSAEAAEALDFYRKQAKTYWLQNDRFLQGMIALALHRTGEREVPALVLKSLTEKALRSEEMGMYWASEPGYYWYQAPIETQAMMVEMFDEVAHDTATVDELRTWLLKQKQTQDWRSPRATLEACYALLLRGTGLLSAVGDVTITLGGVKVTSSAGDNPKEPGTGYFRTSWSGTEIRPDMGRITVSRQGKEVAWGAVYWQYFEDLDRITPAATPLRITKQVFAERNAGKGPVLVPLGATDTLRTGDPVVVRIVLTTDRDLEYVHLKDLRAATLETVMTVADPRSGSGGEEGLSGYRYQDGIGYYRSVTDQAVHFFFDRLPKGTRVFEYRLRANAAGKCSNGIATVQCLYAPEFSAHSAGMRLETR